MTKAQYLTALEARLGALPKDERESALRFYSEYFDDAGEENQQQAAEQLGTPAQVAEQLLSDAGARKAPKERRRIGPWAWVLLVFASPILLALAAAALGLLVGGLAVVFCAMLALMLIALMPVLVSAMFILCGGFTMAVGLMVTFQSYPTMLLYSGLGLVLLALGVLIFKPCVAFMQRALSVVFRFSGWLVRKMKALRARI